jgi:hypothetical protein
MRTALLQLTWPIERWYQLNVRNRLRIGLLAAYLKTHNPTNPQGNSTWLMNP